MSDHISAAEYNKMGGHAGRRRMGDASDKPAPSFPKSKGLVTIGIDPGSHTGVAVYNRLTNEIILAKSVDFWTLFHDVLPMYPPDLADVVVEDARLNKSLYARHNGQNAGTREAIGRKVGNVQAESRLIIEGLKRTGYNVLPIRPGGEKWNQEQMARITGYTARTNEHVRDAIRFCYGVKFIRQVREND